MELRSVHSTATVIIGSRLCVYYLCCLSLSACSERVFSQRIAHRTHVPRFGTNGDTSDWVKLSVHMDDQAMFSRPCIV